MGADAALSFGRVGRVYVQIEDGGRSVDVMAQKRTGQIGALYIIRNTAVEAHERQ